MEMWEEGQESQGQCHTSVNRSLSSHVTHPVLAVKISDLKVGKVFIYSRKMVLMCNISGCEVPLQLIKETALNSGNYIHVQIPAL